MIGDRAVDEDEILELYAALAKSAVQDLRAGPKRAGKHYETARRYLEEAGLLERVAAYYELPAEDESPHQLELAL